LWGPSIIGISFSILLFISLQEKPKDSNKDEETKSSSKKQGDDRAYTESVKLMLLSPSIWYLGLGYAFLTTVRVGLSDWSLVLLRTFRSTSETTSRDCLVALESGGFLGGLAVGIVSDVLFRGLRTPAMISFTALIACPACYFIFNGPRDLLPISYFAFGFGSFGPHVLVGLLARELFPAVSSTAGTFAKSLAQIGGALSGVPISMLAQNYGWSSAGSFWVGCCVFSSAAFSMMLSSEYAHHHGKRSNGLKND
jgi:sugar phosphate permease